MSLGFKKTPQHLKIDSGDFIAVTAFLMYKVYQKIHTLNKLRLSNIGKGCLNDFSIVVIFD